MSKKIDKKNGNKKIFIIVGVCLLVLVLVICSLLFINKKSNKENEAWVNDYKDYIIRDLEFINKEKNDYNNNTKEINISFIKANNEDVPYLLYDRKTEYEGKEEHINYVIAYDQNNIAYGLITYEINKEGSIYGGTSHTINYIYDKETKDSDWYMVKRHYTKSVLDEIKFTKLSKEVEYKNLNGKLKDDMIKKYGSNYQKEEEFINKEKEYNDELDKLSITFNGDQLNDYSNKMIDLTDQINLSVFKFTKDSSKSEINKVFNDGLEKYNDYDKNFDKVVKKIIEKQNKIIDEAIEKIEEEKQENNTTEEETVNNNVNNNNNNTVQNNSDNGINVGGMIVKYGTYNGDAAESGSTLVINRGGTCTYNGSPCTYSVSRQDFGQDSSSAGSYEDCLSININGRSICYMPSNGGSRINNGGFEFYYVG